MRLIVISVGIGLLLYGLAHNALPSPTLAIVGFLIITSGVVSRPLGRLGIPEASGAMLVGLVVGLSAVLSSQWAPFLQPFWGTSRACQNCIFSRHSVVPLRYRLSTASVPPLPE